MKKFIVLFAALLCAGAALANGLSGSVTPQLGGGISAGFDGGISAPTGAVAPPAGCSAGQLDFSDPCNTTLYMVGL